MDAIEFGINICPMGLCHVDEVEEIENYNFEHPWTRDEIEECRRAQYFRAIVALIIIPREKMHVGGYAFVEEDRFRFTVRNIAVAEKWHRHGIGRELLNHFIAQLSGIGCHEIYELVRETNLQAQQFYKAMGFVAQRPRSNAYDVTDEDA